MIKLSFSEAEKIVKKAIDLHVHGPDIIPRRFNDSNQLSKEEGRIFGLVLKSHFQNMVEFVEKIKDNYPKLKLFGSLTFNMGFKPGMVYDIARKTNYRLIFFGPTVAAKNHLNSLPGKFAISPDWVKGSDFKPILKKEISPVVVLDNKGKVKVEVLKTLEAIKKTGSVFATGHLSTKEILALLPFFRKMQITVILTHPLGNPINLSDLQILSQLVREDIYYEYCQVVKRDEDYPGKYDLKKVVETLKKLSPWCVISSDSGQVHNPGPGDCLVEACQQLSDFGLTKKELETFLIKNPRKILKI